MKCIKKIQAITVAAAMVFALIVQGCSIFNSYAGLPELPANAESFKTYDSTTGELMCINVGGREYSPYGDLEGRVKDDYVRDCLGYVNDDKNIRVYSLNEDPYDNYLLVISTRNFKTQTQFWRDCSTCGQDIFTPGYIKSSEFEDWEDSGYYYEMREFRIDVKMEAEDVMELAMYFTINGDTDGSAGVRNADWSEMKEDYYDLGIPEMHLKDKYDYDDPFDVEIHFTVTTMSGSQAELDDVYTGTVKLGDKDNLTLTGNAQDGYRIN